LNADAEPNTAREGATKKRKDQPPQTTKKVPFQTHNNKKNKTCEKCDPMKLELSYIQKCTTMEGVATEREREYTY
jgi:hypothetical protein